MRDTEIEVFDQTDVIFAGIINEKKPNVQKIIDDLSSLSFKYSSIRVPFRNLMLSPELQSKGQTSFSIFQLFISSNLLQIIANHTNLKASLERIEGSRHQRLWHDIIGAEIEAFLSILLYMGYNVLPRMRDY
jgi:hypothetical protein